MSLNYKFFGGVRHLTAQHQSPTTPAATPDDAALHPYYVAYGKYKKVNRSLKRRGYPIITFLAGEGTGVKKQQWVVKGGEFILPENGGDFTAPEHYAFSGYTIKNDESKTIYYPGDKITLTEDICFIAYYILTDAKIHISAQVAPGKEVVIWYAPGQAHTFGNDFPDELEVDKDWYYLKNWLMDGQEYSSGTAITFPEARDYYIIAQNYTYRRFMAAKSIDEAVEHKDKLYLFANCGSTNSVYQITPQYRMYISRGDHDACAKSYASGWYLNRIATNYVAKTEQYKEVKLYESTASGAGPLCYFTLNPENNRMVDNVNGDIMGVMRPNASVSVNPTIIYKLEYTSDGTKANKLGDVGLGYGTTLVAFGDNVGLGNCNLWGGRAGDICPQSDGMAVYTGVGKSNAMLAFYEIFPE